MKTFLSIILMTLFATSALASAEPQELSVRSCSKDPTKLYVEISGARAMQIYRHFAQTLKVPVDDLGTMQTNQMVCQPSYSSTDQLQDVVCSFLLIGTQSVPYPQPDPIYEQGKPVLCD